MSEEQALDDGSEAHAKFARQRADLTLLSVENGPQDSAAAGRDGGLRAVIDQETE